mmetsp:Transcript_27719/g.30808  ORF Transcript_27719/g.30808 Transcript_27719/m.30808 type:complete len:150 (+) Transcript_27719:576-1025(+)
MRDHYKLTPTSKQCNIVWVSRKNTGRVFDEEQVLFDTVLKHVSDDSKVKFTMTLVDFASLSWEKQLKLASTTTILIGPHGAGLTHTLFQPDNGVIIELLDSDTASNLHYSNLAKWSGRTYLSAHTDQGDIENLSSYIADSITYEINKQC